MSVFKSLIFILALSFVCHPQTEGSKLQRDLRAYLEAVKGDTNTHTQVLSGSRCTQEYAGIGKHTMKQVHNAT